MDTGHQNRHCYGQATIDVGSYFYKAFGKFHANSWECMLSKDGRWRKVGLVVSGEEAGNIVATKGKF